MLKIRLNQASPIAFHVRSTMVEALNLVKGTITPEDGAVERSASNPHFDPNVDMRLTIYRDGTVDISDRE